MLVVDASVVINACLSKAGFAPLKPEKLVAPPLLWSEVSSALHQARWRLALSERLAEAALSRLSEAPISPRRPGRLLAEAWRVADELGWAKTYDAEYVALARLLHCRLVTLDARLQRSASRLAEIIGPRQV